MAEYLAPGDYDNEFDSKIKAMEGVETSIAGFIGVAIRGQVTGKPMLITSMDEFEKYFGSYLGVEYGKHRFLSYAVEQFFMNDGNSCYVMRVAPKNQKSAAIVIENILTLAATSSGDWGNNIKIQFHKSHHEKTMIKDRKDTNQYIVYSTNGFNIGDVVEYNEQYYNIINIDNDIIELDNDLGIDLNKSIQSVSFDVQVTCDDVNELYNNCSFNPISKLYVVDALKESLLMNVSLSETHNKNNIIDFYKMLDNECQLFSLSGGQTIALDQEYEQMYIGQDNGTLNRSGIQAFLDVDNVNIMAIPGITNAVVQGALISHCEQTRSRFAILDFPLQFDGIDKAKEVKKLYNTSFAAIYHPWLNVYDPLLKKDIYIPPSGTIAGIYARVDQARGVHKAPANEIVKNVTGISTSYSEGDRSIAERCGLNFIRVLPGMGIRVWGARTCSSDVEFKFIHTQRLMIYIEESIKRNLAWVENEYNDEYLWSRVTKTIKPFLNTLWRNGALCGLSSDEAFQLTFEKDIMTQLDPLNGKFILNVAVAINRPLEYITFKVVKQTMK